MGFRYTCDSCGGLLPDGGPYLTLSETRPLDRPGPMPPLLATFCGYAHLASWARAPAEAERVAGKGAS